MSEQEKQEGQKTVVSFIAGLLIGGLLVWVFGGSPNQEMTPEETNDTHVTEEAQEEETQNEETTKERTSTLNVGNGAVDVVDQPAGNVVTLTGATFPTEEGWVAVRTYPNGQLGSILGAARYSKEQELVPSQVHLLAPTTSGKEYAVVFFSEDGDHEFNLASDAQIGDVFGTFKAK